MLSTNVRTIAAMAGPVPTILVAALIAAGLGACATPANQQVGASPGEDSLPADPNALVLGAEVALQRGQFLEASRAYVRAAHLANDEVLAEHATRVAHEHQQWSLVLAAAERWLEQNHTNEEARRFAAFAALHLYQIDRAAEHLSALLDTAFINAAAGFLALLPQLAQEGSAPAATAVLQRLVLKYPDLTEAHYALGRAALQSDNFALALEHARKAYELGPYWVPAGLLLAQVQLVRGQADEGLALAREIIARDGQDAYRLEYALMLLQAGKDAEAREELNALGDNQAAAAVAERALADMEFQSGNPEAAAQRYSNLVSSGRFVYEALFYLGAIAESRQSWDEAVQIYGRVTTGDMAMGAQTRVARIKAQQKDVKAGLAHLDDFVSAHSQYRLDAIAARASLLSNMGDQAGALALLERGLKQYPDSAELRFAYVFQLEDADKVGAAVTELRKLVAERPGDPAAANALGYTLVDRTQQHSEGMKLIEQALAATPDSGAVLDSMGWSLHRLNRHEEALEYLQQAKRRINDPEVDLHLGEVLIAMGRTDEAREILESAAQRYPESSDLQQRLKSLQN